MTIWMRDQVRRQKRNRNVSIIVLSFILASGVLYSYSIYRVFTTPSPQTYSSSTAPSLVGSNYCDIQIPRHEWFSDVLDGAVPIVDILPPPEKTPTSIENFTYTSEVSGQLYIKILYEAFTISEEVTTKPEFGPEPKTFALATALESLAGNSEAWTLFGLAREDEIVEDKLKKDPLLKWLSFWKKPSLIFFLLTPRILSYSHKSWPERSAA